MPLPAHQQKPCPERPRPGQRQNHKKRTRVQLYLPIADIPVNVFLILAMGAAVGFVSGMFGIGGGFLMAPLFIFFGIAPPGAGASRARPHPGPPVFRAVSLLGGPALPPRLSAV